MHLGHTSLLVSLTLFLPKYAVCCHRGSEQAIEHLHMFCVDHTLPKIGCVNIKKASGFCQRPSDQLHTHTQQHSVSLYSNPMTAVNIEQRGN